ncbi:MAG: hypothetical protein M0Z61_04935 [Nitrospiraceae bacterium]|nr:hypothetical protein [Nitrospiraceae bacterium]
MNTGNERLSRKHMRLPYLRQTFNMAAVIWMALIIGLVSSTNAWSCASCGCMLSPDWKNLQFCSTPGIGLDLRWDYINQDQLRGGTGTISPIAASQIVNNGQPQEVEKYTRNNYFTLGVNYGLTPYWGINVQVPWIDRSHSTLGTASDGITPGPGGGQYDSHTSSLGDIKVVGHYQGFSPRGNFGVLFGVKLPTGSYTETGTSTDPAAPGPVPIDPGLQSGTGSTDAILGVFYTNTLGPKWGYFAQTLVQSALIHRDEYKPGDGFNANLGVRYMGFSGFFPQMQLNFRAVKRDSGAVADTVSTGGTLLYVSPGIDIPVSFHFSVYGFVQLPVYQNLNGVQLAPRYTTSLGVHYAF